MEGKNVCLLQLPEFRLDSRLPIKGLQLEPSQAQQLSVIGLQALKSALSICREAKINAVLIPGNLIDASTITASTLSELLEILSAVPVPVFINPGSLDPFSGDSVYVPEVISSRCGRDWPRNVHIFRDNERKEIVLPNNQSVSVAGIARQNLKKQVSLRALSSSSKASLRILTAYLRADDLAGTTLPEVTREDEQFALSASDLRSLGYNYAALSGLPNCRFIKTAEGELLGSYAGSATGMTMVENGPRYALMAQVDLTGTPVVRIEQLELPVPQVKIVNLEYKVDEKESLLANIEKALAASGARPGLDLVYVRIFGTGLPEEENLPGPEKISRAFPRFIILDQRRSPQNIKDATPAELRLIALLKELRHHCQSTSSGTFDDSRYPAPLSSSLVDEAIFYGLEALRAGKVTLKNVD